MKTYCTECGQATEYISNSPKFCQSCGTAFNLLTREKNKQSALASKSLPRRIEMDDEDEDGSDEEAVKVPNISKLDVEIQTDKRFGISLKDVLAQAHSSLPENYPPEDSPPPISQGEFLTQFKKEAGTLRNKSPNE